MARTRRQQESEPPEEAEVAQGREHGVLAQVVARERLRNARLMVAVSPRF